MQANKYGDIKIKDKLKYIMPYLIFAAIIIFYQIAGYKHFEDDIDVAENTAKTFGELFPVLRAVVNSWSSRVLINPLIWIVFYLGVPVWAVLNVPVMVLMYWGLNKLCFKESNLTNTYLLLLILLLFPYNIAVSVGWVVTSMTYLWPATAAVFACFSIRRYLDNQTITLAQAAGYIILTVYAANKEELSVMLFIIFGIMIIISANEKRLSRIFIIQCIVCMAEIIFHLTSGNNQERFNSAVNYAGSQTNQFGILDKLDLGINATIMHMFNDFDFVTLWFLIVLLIGAVVLTKKLLPCIISFIPLLVWIIDCFGEEKQMFGLLERETYRSMFGGPLLISQGKYKYVSAWLQLALAIILIVCIALSLLFIFGKTRKSIILIFMLAGGFCGRMTVAFGENGWMPYSRTYTFVYMAFIIIMAIIIKECFDRIKGRKQDILTGVLIGMAMLEQALVIINLGIIKLEL